MHMLKVGPNEAERFQVIAALRAGKTFAEATAELRRSVEPDWFERNEKHLLEVANPPTNEPPAKGAKK
jgi:hypothetical protein